MSKVPFFKAEEIMPRVWKIQYDFVSEENTPVYAYLMEGRDYALVIDTMLGYGNLRAFCETLTDKPMKLVNTHFHLDHIGGNYDFDTCYIHPLDIPYMYNDHPASKEQLLERAKKAARPEYADLLTADDFTPEHPIKVYPVFDGDIFDLGDRQIEVIEVGGHSPGSIVLLDRKLRVVYSGDACNGNTLLGFGVSLSIEEYLENLLRLKKFQPEFDMMYGGHQIFKSDIIDEGIELCAKVIAGTDDREERVIFGNRKTYYGAKHHPVQRGRMDGKNFNIAYNPNNILKKPHAPQVITTRPVSQF
jgi:glyoxylase-like metal-dependent hydrolase (beta-lactamase superfamily II)